jgi:hypothetical protein
MKRRDTMRVDWRNWMRSVWMLVMGCLAIGMMGCDPGEVGEEMETLEINASPFLRVEIRDVFEVELVQDFTWGVEIVGSARAMKNMDVHFEGTTLVLDRTRKGDYRHPHTETPKAYIHFDSLLSITAYETCKITSRFPITGSGLGIVDYSKMIEVDLEMDLGTFYFWNTPNASRFHLRGRSKELKLWNIGLSSVDADELESQYVLVENHSQGDCRVRAVDKLEYSLNGTGNIVYFGSPVEVVPLEGEGSGRLIKGE